MIRFTNINCQNINLFQFIHILIHHFINNQPFPTCPTTNAPLTTGKKPPNNSKSNNSTNKLNQSKSPKPTKSQMPLINNKKPKKHPLTLRKSSNKK